MSKPVRDAIEQVRHEQHNLVKEQCRVSLIALLTTLDALIDTLDDLTKTLKEKK